MNCTFSTTLQGTSTGPTGIVDPSGIIHQLGGGKKLDGNDIEVHLELDLEPRETEIPEELLAALQKTDRLEAFSSLAPSRRKEHVRQVSEAKAPETRARRIDKILDSLK